LLDRLPVYDALGHTPAERRAGWRGNVMAPQSESDLARIRESARTGKPLGEPEWIARNAARLGIDLNPRPKGRPRKVEK
jgi:putative transposase